MKILNKVFFVCMLLFLSTQVNAQKLETSLKYHQGLQKENSYETWKKNQPKKRLKAAKFVSTVNNERGKEDKKNKRLNAKINRLMGRESD